MSLSRGVNLFKKIDSLRKPIYGHLISSSRNSGGGGQSHLKTINNVRPNSQLISNCYCAVQVTKPEDKPCFSTFSMIRRNMLDRMDGSDVYDWWSYRVGAYPPSRFQNIYANTINGAMWWWILWHFWHEPEHVTGEFPYPDPSAWTNQELGIPPDDAD